MIKKLKIATAIMGALVVVFFVITVVKSCNERNNNEPESSETTFVFGQDEPSETVLDFVTDVVTEG